MQSLAVPPFGFASFVMEAPPVRGWLGFGAVNDSVVASGAEAEPDGEVDEALLMQRVAQGDVDAYRQLVHRFLPGLHTFSYRMLGTRAEAEEICQETLLRVWKQADRYVSRAKLSTWIYRIAHNLAVDRLRRRRPSTDLDGLAQLPAPELAAAGQDELALELQRALAELPERQRAALDLVHYQGLSNAEAAEVLGVKLRALESLLARGRRALRERLASLPPEEGP